MQKFLVSNAFVIPLALLEPATKKAPATANPDMPAPNAIHAKKDIEDILIVKRVLAILEELCLITIVN